MFPISYSNRNKNMECTHSIVELYHFVIDAIEFIERKSETGQNGLPKKESEEVIQKLENVRDSFRYPNPLPQPVISNARYCPYQARVYHKPLYHQCPHIETLRKRNPILK
ncbi:MAG: hypothetical protein GF353_14160 [Candidatus Lokiarchaeota archaeon]|nr:hypothetical protein [Candidatus Lokiarchaeota archaeon]